MILGLGVPELVIILVVVLVIFGPKNLPKIGSALGKTVKNVREGMEEGEDEKPAKKPASDDDAIDVVADVDDAGVNFEDRDQTLIGVVAVLKDAKGNGIRGIGLDFDLLTFFIGGDERI